MSNLLEKALITGFGIFLLITFLSIITPLLGIISDFNRNQNDDLYSYTRFINEFDNALQQVINNPGLIYLEEIEHPMNLNITLENNYAKFYYPFDNAIKVEIIEFSEFFKPRIFNNLQARTYILSISTDLTLINVSFI